MIPQQLTADATLKIEFTDRLTKTKRTLTASIGGNKKSWESGKLYTYSVSSTGVVVTPIVKLVKNGTEDEFPIDSIPFSGAIRNVKLTAFVRVTQKGTKTKDLAVPFKIYSAAGTSGDWVEATWEPQQRQRHIRPQRDHRDQDRLPLVPASTPVQQHIAERFPAHSAKRHQRPVGIRIGQLLHDS